MVNNETGKDNLEDFGSREIKGGESTNDSPQLPEIKDK